jgi:hypothetical protein
VINVEKSRYVKEKSKIPISVSWDGGIERYSGLMDVAVAGGYVVKPSNGWYAHVDRSNGTFEGKKYRMAESMTADFWDPIFEKTDFKEFLIKSYTIGHKSMFDSIALEMDDAASD